jgi:prolyl-tRNA synthetase
MAKAITNKDEDYNQWYNDIVLKAELADYSDVRGCMVIRPYGFSIWEKMQEVLDQKFKETGHQNAYFPLFIPKSFMSREASHVEGFAKECAVVTHYRLKNDTTGEEIIVDPEAKLQEELIVRPTSETIIWNQYRKWIQSYRDLPLLINQWANVVRWEMRTRLFLRTSEFLWQEGHTAHATRQEAEEEALKMLNVYKTFLEDWLAIPPITGVKSASERFAGAVDTYTIEALMQDGKALQAGTSHFLGQNFAKAFDVTFLNENETEEYVWATSWGVSTRLMGALIMAHSDDDGLILPPKLAPTKVVIIPIYKGDKKRTAINEKAESIKKELEDRGITVEFDNSEQHKPGWKFAEYEMKGVPVRIVIGPRDIENNTLEIARRDVQEKSNIQANKVGEKIERLLDKIQSNIYQKALDFKDNNTYTADDYEDFKQKIKKGGFVLAHWDGTTETEQKIKDETQATIRCIPMNTRPEAGKCIHSGQDSAQKVIFAKAY